MKTLLHKLKLVVFALLGVLTLVSAIYFIFNSPREEHVIVDRPTPPTCVVIQESDGVKHYFLIDTLDLQGGVMILPENGILTIYKSERDGKVYEGALCNGTLRGQNSLVVAPRHQVFYNVKFEGTFQEKISPEWSGI